MKNFIDKWLREGLITDQQAKQMYADMDKESREKSSRKIIMAFSTIGAALVGIGAILLVASNWQVIPALLKILMLAAITFGSAFSGYYLKYASGNYPRTGSSLIFLSALLYGALIFLTAQVYHVNPDRRVHLLILAWLLAILPYVYIFRSKAIAFLASALFMVWFNFFVLYGHGRYDYEDIIRLLPLMYCLCGLLLICFGKVNEFIKNFYSQASVFAKVGVFIICICLFTMTFGYFTELRFYPDSIYSYAFFSTIIDLLLLYSLIMFLASFFANPARKNNFEESLLITALIAGSAILLHFGHVSRLAANLFFALFLFGMIASGYKKREMFLVNLSIFWFILFIGVKYFDFFWMLLPRAAFFIAGGIILVAVAWFFERKRRGLKTEFESHYEA